MAESQTAFELVLDPELAKAVEQDPEITVKGLREAGEAVSRQLRLETAATVVTIVADTAQLAEVCARLGRRIVEDRKRKRIAVRCRLRDAVLDVAGDVEGSDLGRRIEVQARA
jgi:hypothetical protein